MRTRLFLLIALICSFSSTVLAQSFPSYYPEEGFRRTGHVDSVDFARNVIVINDIRYQLADSPIVHSLTSYSVSIARLRPGITVAYKTGGNQLIEEFWLLPLNYGQGGR